MSITPTTINAGTRTKNNSKRVGRGNASGKGTYSARGLKGQRSRSGGKGGLLRRAFKAELQKVPKSRGFTSPHIKPETVTLNMLERVAEDGMEINPFILKKLGLISSPKHGVKIVATGELKKKLVCTGCIATKQALVAIEKAGGKLVS